MHAAGNPSRGDERGSDAAVVCYCSRCISGEEELKGKHERLNLKENGEEKRRRRKHNQMCHRMARRQWLQRADRNEATMLTKK